MIEQRFGRNPDVVIGDDHNPYLLRWWVIPRNRFFNIYLHKFCRSDDDRALHDHPWLFNVSVLLEGEYIEHLPNGLNVIRRAGKFSGFKFRWGKAPHRVELFRDWVWSKYFVAPAINSPEKPVWTLFITGPKVREWGFYCPQGWRHWRDFVSVRPGGNSVGRGCD